MLHTADQALGSWLNRACCPEPTWSGWGHVWLQGNSCDRAPGLKLLANNQSARINECQFSLPGPGYILPAVTKLIPSVHCKCVKNCDEDVCCNNRSMQAGGNGIPLNRTRVVVEHQRFERALELPKQLIGGTYGSRNQIARVPPSLIIIGTFQLFSLQWWMRTCASHT